jgi:FG-GAP repeat
MKPATSGRGRWRQACRHLGGPAPRGPATRGCGGTFRCQAGRGARSRHWLVLLRCLAMTLPALAGSAPAMAIDAWSATPLPLGVAQVTNAERGFAVALDGNRAVVGARFDGPTGAGRVYVFFWNGTAWIEEAPPLEGEQPGDQFGISVALHGDTLAVGAVGEERDQQLPTGKVCVFAGTGVDGSKQWSEQLTVVGVAGVRQVGRAVALDEGWLAVAGTRDLPDGEHGIVRVYSLLAQYLVQDLEGEALLRVDPQPGDRFGESLAMAGGILVVGAPAHAGGGGLAAAGATYVYVPAIPLAVSLSLLPVATLQAADAAADGNFGSAVAVSGRASTLAIGAAGAPWPSAGIGRPGAVYVFTSGGGAWTQQARLAPNPASAGAGDRFGQAVAIDGDLLVVGAPQHPAGHAAPATGAAFLFQRDPAGNWAEVPGAAATTLAPVHALYGFAVALSQNGFLVGAPLAAGTAGAVFAFLPADPNPEAATAARAAATAQPTTASPAAAAHSAATASFAGLPVPP